MPAKQNALLATALQMMLVDVQLQGRTGLWSLTLVWSAQTRGRYRKTWQCMLVPSNLITTHALEHGTFTGKHKMAADVSIFISKHIVLLSELVVASDGASLTIVFSHLCT
jgi:hypothetical protein